MSATLDEAARHAATLQRLTAATRASLEQHVRAEEQELWPLFAEYFTEAEQDHLVGVIIGRTGAEVLQAMLPWVTGGHTSNVPVLPLGQYSCSGWSPFTVLSGFSNDQAARM